MAQETDVKLENYETGARPSRAIAPLLEYYNYNAVAKHCEKIITAQMAEW